MPILAWEVLAESRGTSQNPGLAPAFLPPTRGSCLVMRVLSPLDYEFHVRQTQWV